MSTQNIVDRLRIKAGVIEMGEKIAWGSDSALMREAAFQIEALEALRKNAQPVVCLTCGGHGLIGGMTIEGGDGLPCPECSQGHTVTVPEGWVLAPLEPTEDMRISGFESDAWDKLGSDTIKKKGWPYSCKESSQCVADIYRAMLQPVKHL